MASPDRTGDRFVVIGLAAARSTWPELVRQWSTNGVIPVEFVRCVSAEEVRARIGSGRAFSALLVDSSSQELDRDLFDLATVSGVGVIVVDDERVERDWRELGADASVSREFDRQSLLDLLGRHATPVGRFDQGATPEVATTRTAAPDGHLVAVTGGAGAGVSTVAMAIAQSLSDGTEQTDAILLADFALRADQAMLHDARDVVPGLQELVDAHRAGVPNSAEVRSMLFKPDGRTYHLLLGLRRHQDWAALRSKAFASSLASLLCMYRVVVADVEPDVEGEEETGAIEVEERNMLSRSTLIKADLVVVVGTANTKGINDLVRTTHDLARLGVPGRVMLPVLNRTSRSMRSRSSVGTALGALLQPVCSGVSSAVHLPEKHRIEEAIRDGARLPAAYAEPIGQAVRMALARRLTASPPAPVKPLPVKPGTLGHLSREVWNEDGAA